MVKTLFNMILIFLYYLICICIYIIYNSYKSKRIYKNSEILKNQIKDITLELIEELNNESIVDEDKILAMKEILKSKKYNKQIIKYLLEFDDRDSIIKLVKETRLIDDLLSYKEKDHLDKAYKIYLIGEFQLDNFYGYLTKSYEDKSMYVQVNTIKTLSKLGDENQFINCIKFIIENDSLIHEKIILEAMYSFNGDRKKLNSKLEKVLKSSDENDEFKKIILNHFINIRYNFSKEFVYDLLKKVNTSKEVKISCIRYFMTIKYNKAQNLLLDLLKDENWEIRAISASALKKYNNKDVVLGLKESIKDREWYVRQNSARSLYYLAKNKEDLIYIINGEDRYASDSILSILSEEDNLQEYLADIQVEEVLEKFEYKNMENVV